MTSLHNSSTPLGGSSSTPLRAESLLHRIRQEYQQAPPRWTFSSHIPATHHQWIQKEARAPSDFDTLRLRERVLQHKNSSTVYAMCPYGTLIVYFEQHDSTDLPWELWGRILRLFYEGKRFTIYLLASSVPRRFPSSSPIKPEHINGGYTYPCRPDTIVIYRAEDATRVLLHELQHACCLDHHEQGIDQVEAETEAWAELLYTVLLARGNLQAWRRIWSRQLDWIQRQNQEVKRHIRDSKAFPWRYTIGKEEALRNWFPIAPLSPPSQPTESLRLTVPPTPSQKREQGIRSTSVFL